MSSLLIASQIGLWVMVSFLMLTVFALVRQIGLLHRRIAPVGARMTFEGPPLGAPAPELDTTDLFGRHVTLGAANGRLTMLVFVSPGCSVCRELLPGVRSLWKTEKKHVDLLLLSLSADIEVNKEYVRANRLEQIPFIVSREQAERYQVLSPPYAVLVGTDGLVKSKGIANHVEHLESLLVAARLGHSSIESYRDTRAAENAAPAAQLGQRPSVQITQASV